MTQLDSVEVEVGEHKYFIRKFPALTAANVLGKLNTVLSPLASGIVPLVGVASKGKGGATNLFDADITEAIPMLTSALVSLDGDKLQGTLELLLLKHKNVSVEYDKDGKLEVSLMNRDLLNDFFCGDVQDLFLLAYHVVMVNYGNFFGNLLNQFGALRQEEMQANSKSTGPSTQLNLQTLS